MKKTSPEVDLYLAEAPSFAQPILRKIRKLFHKACPTIEETIKWGFPHFEYKGIVGSMAAFKSHVGFGFWKGKLLKDPHKIFTGAGTMFGLKLQFADDLPDDDIMLDYIREAVALNEAGVKAPRPPRSKQTQELVIPDYFLEALARNPRASATFEAFSYSNRKEYLDWLLDAKQPATRAKRLATTLEWLEEGKTKNWKYEKC